MDFKIDCHYFKGDKPCKFKRSCKHCHYYKPFKFKILIIKLGAIGDVLRSTSLLRGIKRKYPEAHITWLTDPPSVELLNNNPFIDKILSFNQENILRLQVEEFDLLYSIDKEIRGTALAEIVKAKEKKGFGFHKKGNMYPYNEKSRYMFLLGISDELKFEKNQKSYQDFTFEACELEYNNDEYVIELLPEEIEKGEKYLSELGVNKNDTVIGLNTGAGPIYATKKWSEEGFISLAHELKKLKNVKILLLGGEAEKERNSIIKKEAEFVIHTGCNNSLRHFTSIIKKCNLIVTGDTMAMHMAIAMKVPVVSFFGPTCHQEIELYGRGKKIIANNDCPPCYKKECVYDKSCIEKMDYMTVYNSIIEVLKAIK